MNLEKIYNNMSPFELRNSLKQLAEDESKKSTNILLDAGRGNPNWTSASPREAFFTFGQFAVGETRSTWVNGDLAGMPRKSGISLSLKKYIDEHINYPGTELLKNIVNYGIELHHFNPDEWVHELADGIIGDNYPMPQRMLKHIEVIIKDYLKKELYGYNPSLKFDSFAVEGATAGICYIFDSLVANNILKPHDTIAIMTPIFTPYLEIPSIPRYNLNVVKIKASEAGKNKYDAWQYSDNELLKLVSSDVKALFVVNPSNPPSVSIKPDIIKKLIHIVKNYNPNLMIISDDVYGTFVDGFKSLFSYLPFNTIGVYSFSKYFGVTGWRLGTVSLSEKNVFDYLVSKLPEYEKEKSKKRYASISLDPENIKFIDRIAADSRQVALNHTAGLSTPQQVQMCFFAVFSIIDKNSKYKQLTKEICRRRKKLLYKGLGLELDDNPYSASYYTEFDFLEWSGAIYGNDFSNYLKNHCKPVDILFLLAKKSSIVLLNGSGFQGPEWSIRISLANLNDNDYITIGEVLKKILKDYAVEWKKSQKYSIH
ncbi:aspartate 4-decarboxylase [Clostridium tyrobutyricum]|uniref:aspartate 4-decarboxylase n=1 Tax=Clostridium tyrobutyricum TaxID=1519 RepID=UPI002012DE90|nr:aspartate 4-decarboxylase [Clostridium tyrobutyricum]MBR9647130.1 aspartate 4-decarboxylase [Clostridium tyrobutyricum]